ncbi:adenylylsulfatase HINT3 isoform X2 [Iris pallida]|uniref:Adenylylsulfatase HINT3 isoform X2 n=1 Tax=Iris pallida TaxID=29817 RepID=A0AAX6HL29_IRIPA|nr:adenylylsulfatase HINT3 isoform X2 [Iris pallida]
MEQQRRLSVVMAHLHPTPHPGRPFPQDQRPGSDDLSPLACRGEAGAKKEEEEEQDCVFCSIVRGKTPAFKIYEDDVCICILDSNPLSCGHSLIIPKLHYPSLGSTPPLVVASMCSKVPFLSNAIMKATQSDSFNLLVNSGSAAGQEIFHTHFHIIPRKAGDKLWPSENSKRRRIKYNKETLRLVDCIREKLSALSDVSCVHEVVLPKN